MKIVRIISLIVIVLGISKNTFAMEHKHSVTDSSDESNQDKSKENTWNSIVQQLINNSKKIFNTLTPSEDNQVLLLLFLKYYCTIESPEEICASSLMSSETSLLNGTGLIQTFYDALQARSGV